MSGTAYPYPDAFNPDLLERIPLSARTIVDVGCGTGALGAAYKRLNPRARVLGIEADRHAARIAEGRLDEVAVVDVETASFPFDLPDGIDCLIYGDVLEHLRDPWSVLARHVAWLAPDGLVLVSVPNVEHWSVVARLLLGSWDYEPTGLLDSTHLRWFTRETMQRALTGAGLIPIDSAARVFDADKISAFITAMEPALATLGIDRDAYARRAGPLQYVWRARLVPTAPLQLYATMLAPVGGVSQVRVIDPMMCVATEPGIVARLTDGSDLTALPPDTPRLIILHRPALNGNEGLETVRRLLKRDFVIVTEFDDHPAYIPVLQRPDMYNFRAVHAVQTSSEALAGVLRAQNPEVAVFSNAIRLLPEPRNFTDPARLTLFFGALNRELDWPPFIAALNAAAAAAGDRLGFEIVHDRRLFEALASPHKRFSPMLEYQAYNERLSQCEIAFMPLADTPFNRSKSDLKFLEAAAHRVAALASPVVYGESIAQGRTGFIFRDAEELRRLLGFLLDNPEAAREAAEAARREVAARRMLAYQVAERIAWYRDLWTRRAELTAVLYERLPELAPG